MFPVYLKPKPSRFSSLCNMVFHVLFLAPLETILRLWSTAADDCKCSSNCLSLTMVCTLAPFCLVPFFLGLCFVDEAKSGSKKWFSDVLG